VNGDSQVKELAMHRFRNILVAVDGDNDSGAAIACAARLAKRNGASIKLIATVEDLPWYTRLVLPTSEELQTLLVRDRADALERLAEPLRRDGVEVTMEVLRGRRRVEIVREVLRGGYDLLMKEAQPNENVLFGSTDMHLLRTCPCPVWLVKPGRGDRPFAQVLALVDPAPPPDETDLLGIKADLSPKAPDLDAKILEFAESLADDEDAELHVLHAWSTPGEALVRGDSMLAR
jgi:universal stress protein E